MSFWRKKQIADEVAKTVDPSDYGVDRTDALPDPTVKTKDDFNAEDSIYTVGKNKAGNTQLKIKQNYGYSTLTMSPDAVVDLIKILSITIDDHYEIKVNQIKSLAEG